MATKTIKAYIFGYDEEAMKAEIQRVDTERGLPKNGNTTCVKGLFNNENWIIKVSPQIQRYFGKTPVDFEYKEQEID
tara:strand:+ start:2736 stop:2966 length:231 start_codon:yes stop_codon:yes gene_type:complete